MHRLLAGGLLALAAYTNAQNTKFMSEETFSESLTIRPLADGKVDAAFEFTTLVPHLSSHPKLLPLPLVHLLQSEEIGLEELHLSLAAGRWDTTRWGYPIMEGAGGSGAEVWAWMASNDTDTAWTKLTNSLAGQFCASLSDLSPTLTISPRSVFRPHGLIYPHSSPLHAQLVSQRPCTENITPFIALLPCRSRAGLARLLNPHRLFDGDWHGIRVDVRRTEEGVEVKLAVEVVLDPVRVGGTGKRDYSLNRLFDRPIDLTCPVVSSSQVHLVLPEVDPTKPVSWTVHPAERRNATAEGRWGSEIAFDVADVVGNKLDPSLEWPIEFRFTYPTSYPSAPLTVTRHQTGGASQESFGLDVALTNALDVPLEVVYFESLPWHVKAWLHSGRVEVDGERRDDLLLSLHHTPPKDRATPSHLEARLLLPPRTTVHLSHEFARSFIRYTEHPPDAHRGFDLPPGIVFPRSPLFGLPNRIYTVPGLVDLATPDFSMPYNVIIMTSTLIALFFGSVFNNMVRRWVRVDLKMGRRGAAAAEIAVGPQERGKGKEQERDKVVERREKLDGVQVVDGEEAVVNQER